MAPAVLYRDGRIAMKKPRFTEQQITGGPCILPMKFSPAGSGSLVDAELLAQGEVFEDELAVAAAKKGQKAKQLEQEGDHRTRIFSGSERDRTLPRLAPIRQVLRRGCVSGHYAI